MTARILAWPLFCILAAGCASPAEPPQQAAITPGISMDNCQMMGSVMHLVLDADFEKSIPGWSQSELAGEPAIQFHECQQVSFGDRVENSVVFGYLYGRHQNSPSECDTVQNSALVLQWAISNNRPFVDFFQSIGMDISLAAVEFELLPDSAKSNSILWSSPVGVSELESLLKVQPTAQYDVKRELFWMHMDQLQVLRFELSGTSYVSLEDFTEGDINGHQTGSPTGSQWLGTTSYFIDLETDVELFSYDSTQCEVRNP